MAMAATLIMWPGPFERGARWLSGRVSDSGARGPGFETYLRRVVSLSKTLYSPKVLVNYPGSDGSVPTWLKNLSTGTLSLNTTNQRLNKLSFPNPMEASYEIWLIGQVVSEEKWTTDDGGLPIL